MSESPTIRLLSTRGIVRVRRAGTDGWLLLERGHVIEQDLTRWGTDPEVLGESWVKWALLFGVDVQVVEAGDSIGLHLGGGVVDFLEHHLPVTPFHAEELVSHVNNDGFAVGLLLLPEEEVRLVNPVDDPVLRNFAASNPR